MSKNKAIILTIIIIIVLIGITFILYNVFKKLGVENDSANQRIEEIEEVDKVNDIELANFLEQTKKYHEEWEIRQQIYTSVMIKFNGEEKIEKLLKQYEEENTKYKNELRVVGAPATQLDIEWYNLVADIIEYEEISDEENEILIESLDNFLGNFSMPEEIRIRIEKLAGISQERIDQKINRR